ncbi:MAG: 5-methyltetrahydropteroyltriglutamate--homocysteine S-methyltransferase [Gammaproteobacteria bacterium]
MTKAHCLGFPRIGRDRETKKAVEAYWRGEINASSLFEHGQAVRMEAWEIQKAAGLDYVTVGDFSWYDHVLDTALMLGVIPERFGVKDKADELDTFFRMARGRAPTGQDAPALEMTKWFDTNYHYMVPELTANQSFSLFSEKLFREIEEAIVAGYTPKPVLLGPLSFLWLSKAKESKFNKLSLLESLLPVYGEILKHLNQQKVEWLQIDEPILALDLPQAWKDAFESTYSKLRGEPLKLMLTTYFGALESNTQLACRLPTAGLHIDLVRAPKQLTTVLDQLPAYKVLSVGIVNGRNIWRTDLSEAYDNLKAIKDRIGDRLWIGSSCSLLHSPVDLNSEKKLDNEIKNWLAFAAQKVEEIGTLTKAIQKDKFEYADVFEASDQAQKSRATSLRIHNPAVKSRMATITPSLFNRAAPFEVRADIQKRTFDLPLFPTTSIGSFPQTTDVRALRRDLKAGKISKIEYEASIKAEIKKTVQLQEEIGLDVLVHGESERNDMVEYFGEQLAGFAFTEMGWVQSYGSRCVKPPIIYGDVSRPQSMTVAWSKYAQSLTMSPMKGMLTGPVTILCWSFVRDDQPKQQTAMQIALALRDEILDLEENGIKIIQLDEPAFREGLPLREKDWPQYLEWAVNAFKLSVAGVENSTQIHTHMCYSEFNDVIESIAAMDADVITIETSRSQMELLEAFEAFSYPNEIGPGVYDIHSPRVPTLDDMIHLLEKASKYIPANRLWVNPDCGLKTRDWPETQAALKNMVKAASILRDKFKQNDNLKAKEGVI